MNTLHKNLEICTKVGNMFDHWFREDACCEMQVTESQKF